MAVRLVEGGLQSYDPDQASKSYVKKTFKRGSSSSRSSSSSRARAAAEATNAKKAADALKVAQQKAQAEAQLKLQEAQALAEKKRILDFRARLIAQNARRNVRSSKDARTGDKLKIIEWEKNGNKVRKVENLTKGFVTYNRYSPGVGGGSVRQTGGVTVGATPTRKESKMEDLSPSQQIELVNLGYKPEDFQNFGEKLRGLSGISVKTKRSADNIIKKISSGIKINNEERAILLAAQFIIPIQQATVGITELPSFAMSLIKNPKNIISVPGKIYQGIKQSGAEIISLAKVSPSSALARIGGEIFVIVASGKAIKVTGKVTGSVANKVNPFLKRVKNGNIIVRATPREIFLVRGKTRYLTKRVLKPSFKRPFSSVSDFLKGRKPGQFKKFTKDPGLALKLQTVKTGATPLSKQALLAGQEVTAVNAAADQLTSWLKRKKIIRKPFNLNGLEKKFPKGELSFPSKIQKILKKFDNGTKLTTREFADVNKWLQKNIASNTTLLERSLYLDPASGLRISRLGIQKARDATFKDILKGNFRLWNRAGKPQILVFENAKVAKFPKYLTNVKRKLLAGKKLTVAETNKLIEWQVKVGSGKFKPVGSTIYQGGIELEITLAPGELIKRIKRVGTVVIENKRVSIVTAEVFKPTKKLLLQMKKANLGKLAKTQITSLEKSLSKKLGRRIRIETPTLRKTISKISRRTDANIPVLRVRAGGFYTIPIRGIRTFKRVSKVKRRVSPKRTTRKTPKRTTRKRVTSKRKPVKRTTRTTPNRTKRGTTKRTTRTTPKRTTRGTPRRTIIRPPVKEPVKPTIIPRVPKGFKSKTISKKVQVFYVKEKVRGKIQNLTPRPLTLREAKDFLAYRLDNRLSRSGWFKPIGKANKVVKIPAKMKGYFSRNSRKLRPFKIRVGKKRQIRNGYIEKQKYTFDSSGERKQLRSTRRKVVVKKRRVKRKLTPSQRKNMLRNLKKARAAKRRK